MTLLYEDPELIGEGREFMLQVQMTFGKSQIDAGADAIWVGDLNAASHLISLAHYKRFAFDPAKRMMEEYKKSGCLTFFHHNEENIEYIKVMADLIEKESAALNIRSKRRHSQS